MENRKFNLSIIKCQLSILLLSLLLSGCGGGNQTSDSAMVRRAQIIADENIQLKKTVEKKDEQISGLSAELQQSKAEMTKQIEQLKADYESLNTKFAESQQTFEKTVADYQASLKTCTEQLDAKPTPCEEVEAKYAQLYADLLKMFADCATKLEKYEAADPNVQPQPDTQ